MNYIPQLVKMLGVEIGERFEVSGHEFDKYYFSNDGLFVEGFNSSLKDTLEKILTGKAKIRKLPWKPKEGDTYFRPNFGTCFTPDYRELTWSGCRDEEYAYELGMVCRTKDEAMAKAKKMLAAARGNW